MCTLSVRWNKTLYVQVSAVSLSWGSDEANWRDSDIMVTEAALQVRVQT